MQQFGLVDAAKAAQILGSRWENDPLRLFKPSPKQKMFWECTKSEAALLGSNRCGKSDALAAIVAALARFGNPNPLSSYACGGRLEIIDRAMSIWVVTLSERLGKEGIQPKIVSTAYTAAETHPAFIPQSEIDSWNINEQTWRLKNGSIIGFKTADAGREVFQSAARDMVAFDEICEWEVYKEATFRVPGGGRRLLIRLAATLLPPLGVAGGVSWYYPEKIKPYWAAGNKENQPCNPHPNLDLFTMGMRDNPHINPDEISRLEQMFPPGSLERRIRVDGELLPSIGGTMAYPGFNRQMHVDQRVTPDALDPRAPLCLCVDFNVSPCIWEVGQRLNVSGTDTWFMFDEITSDQCNLGMMTEEFRRRYPTHGAALKIYGDQTGTNRSVQSGVSNYYVMQEALKGYPVPFEMCLPERNPPVVDRINAMNRQLGGSNGRVGLIVGPQCEELIADFEEVLRDPKGGIKKSHNMDSPYYKRTHASDAVGYAVAYTDPVPRFIAVGHGLRSIPRPGYLGRGGATAGRMGAPPASYDVDGRIRRMPGGGIRPPKRYNAN